MPRCYSCGTFTKKPHREFDGRAERAYCALCHSERSWKFEGQVQGTPDGSVSVEMPTLSWWERAKRFLGL